MTKPILIVGGGPAGLAAAHALASVGQPSVLVEKEGRLGGAPILSGYAKLVPSGEWAKDAIGGMVDRVVKDPLVEVHLGAKVTSFDGSPGAFNVQLSDGRSAEVGAAILATGFTHFDSVNKPEWGFGTFPDVVTTTQVEQMISSGKGVRCPSDGRKPKRVAILLCVGSRDRQIGREWCSKICCTVSANLAMEIREELPDCHVYIYYMDIRTFGLYETKYYWKSQEEFKVKYIKARIAEVTSDGEKLVVKGEDTLVKRPITIPFDMVVHAIGMDPNVENPAIAEHLRRRARAARLRRARQCLRQHRGDLAAGRVRRRRGDRAGDDRRLDRAGATRRRWRRSACCSLGAQAPERAGDVRAVAKRQRAGRTGAPAPGPERSAAAPCARGAGCRRRYARRHRALHGRAEAQVGGVPRGVRRRTPRRRPARHRGFRPLCGFMPTVRRRIVPWLEEPAYTVLRGALAQLLESAQRHVRCRPAHGPLLRRPSRRTTGHRWTRDLAAELLHNLDPERYPLMTRWVWDAEANTGVLREIWHGPDVDHTTIAARDDYETFLVLREEIAQFLSTNGVFRDVVQMVDMVCAQVYAEYICEQGGSYLRADFSAPEDPMQHTRRLLGLDGVRAADGRARFAAIDGEAREAFASVPPGTLE